MGSGLTRREFIKWSAGAGAAIGLGSLFPSWLEAVDESQKLPILAQVKGPTAEAVREAVRILGGMNSFVHLLPDLRKSNKFAQFLPRSGEVYQNHLLPEMGVWTDYWSFQ